jgi:anti-sigma B factor antagonist
MQEHFLLIQTRYFALTNGQLADLVRGRVICALSICPGEFIVLLTLSTRTTNDGIVTVDMVGRIVFGDESSLLREYVKKLLPDNKQIIFNLAGVTYIDSGGLGTLVALYTSARTNGGVIKLANLTPRVDDVLQITKLVTVFEVYDSEEKAISSFRKGNAA